VSRLTGGNFRGGCGAMSDNNMSTIGQCPKKHGEEKAEAIIARSAGK